MLGAGVPLIVVSRQLGHANPNITATVYAPPFADDQLDDAAAVFDVSNPVGRVVGWLSAQAGRQVLARRRPTAGRDRIASSSGGPCGRRRRTQGPGSSASAGGSDGRAPRHADLTRRAAVPSCPPRGRRRPRSCQPARATAPDGRLARPLVRTRRVRHGFREGRQRPAHLSLVDLGAARQSGRRRPPVRLSTCPVVQVSRRMGDRDPAKAAIFIFLTSCSYARSAFPARRPM
jgi:hypothetical protein